MKDSHLRYHSGTDSGQAGVDVLANYSIIIIIIIIIIKVYFRPTTEDSEGPYSKYNIL